MLISLAEMVVLGGNAFAAQGDTTRVSVDSSGTQSTGSLSSYPAISGDGRYVAFDTGADNLVADDTNGGIDVFVNDRDTGETTRVSVASDGTQTTDEKVSEFPDISDDGRYVTFQSEAANLVPGDTNGFYDVFVHDRTTGETTRVSVDSDGTQAIGGDSGQPAISGDGRYVAFLSDATNLILGDTNAHYDVFIHDRASGETNRVSVATTDAQTNAHSFEPAISGDGRYVTFHSFADNLVAGDTNGSSDVFVHDRTTGEATRVSVDSDGDQATGGLSEVPAISGDGRYVTFHSFADNLVAGDTNGSQDVFVHDRTTGETTRVSVDSDGTEGKDSSQFAVISGDGRHVAFHSLADNLVAGDTNGFEDVFVHDRDTGDTVRVSVDSAGAQAIAAFSWFPAISDDGSHVAFHSWATNLVADDTNDSGDVFVHQHRAGPPVTTTTTAPVTTTTTGPATTTTTEPVTTTTTRPATTTTTEVVTTTTTEPVTTTTAEPPPTTQPPVETPPPTTEPPVVTPADAFTDDDNSVFEDDINTLAAAGITTGCNPPVNDEFCPNDPLTRGQMAAFLNRVFDLAPSNIDRFIDDNSSVFQSDINSAAAAGITMGCNPPLDDRFCPDDHLTRGQMAAFLSRAFNLTPSAIDWFDDDNTSIFQTDINATASAGIALGCNPPGNDRFCPDDRLTRGQMAAFLNRAITHNNDRNSIG